MYTDAQIQTDIMNELKWEPMLSVNEIGVSVNNGIVTLSGNVEIFAKKLLAEKAAKRVKDVKAVVVEIAVIPHVSAKRNDTKIAETIVDSLESDSLVPEDKIKVKVEDGWVTLEGEVEWNYQRNAARKSIENLLGVKGVSNLIQIISKIKPIEIESKIKNSFERNAILSAEKIHIETHHSKVILSGSVNTLKEKIDAENAAFSAPGVTEVENNLTVAREIPVY